MSGNAILKITDGTTEVNILNVMAGYHVVDWRPGIAGFKGDSLLGYAPDNPLSEGSKPVMTQWASVTESISVNVMDWSQDQLAQNLRNLRQLLRQSSEFWTKPHRDRGDLVYIIAKSVDETNPRYAVIYSASLSPDPSPFQQPLLQRDGTAVSGETDLQIVRGHWMDSIPGEHNCIQLQNVSTPSDYTTDLLNDPYFSQVLTNLWPLDTVYGTQDRVDANCNGTYNGGVGGDKVFYDGIASDFDLTSGESVNIDTTCFASIWENGVGDVGLIESGGFGIWVSIPTSVWSDGDTHYVLYVTTASPAHIFYIAINGSTGDIDVVRTNTPPDSNQINFDAVNSDLVDTTREYWFHIAVMWSEENNFMRLYIDGNFAAQNSAPPLYSVSGFLDEAFIGNNATAGTITALDGHVTKAMFFNEPLSQEKLSEVVGFQRFDLEATCDPVPVNRFYKRAGIDYIYRYDDSLTLYTDLSGQSLPFSLLPASYGTNDAVYFGIDPGRGPGNIDNLMFNLVGGQGYNATWEYWNGSSWATLSQLGDRTNDLKSDGVNPVSWNPSSNLATTTVNSVTAYWYRMRVTSQEASVTYNEPQQQEQAIYTAQNPYVDISGEGIGGDIDGLIRMSLLHAGFGDVSQTTGVRRVILASRERDRGENFSAQLHASQDHLPTGATAFPGANSATATALDKPGGSVIEWTPPSDSDNFQTAMRWHIGSELAYQYAGSYRAILLMDVSAGSLGLGDAYFRLSYTMDNTTVKFKPVTPLFTSIQVGLEMGNFVIPDADLNTLTINIEGRPVDTSGAWTIQFVTLVLMPADEWIVDVETDLFSITYGFGINDRLFIDNTFDLNERGLPEASLSNWLQFQPTIDRNIFQKDKPVMSVGGDIGLNYNRGQRIWIFPVHISGDGLDTNIFMADVEGVKRYLGMRGDG